MVESKEDCANKGVVRALVSELAPLVVVPLRAEVLLAEELGFDSIGLMELAVAIEERLDVDLLQNPDARNLRTLGALERLVAAATEARCGR